MYKISWIVTYLTLQFTRIALGIMAFLVVAGEFADECTLLQVIGLKFGAMAIGFIGCTILSRLIEAVEFYCHEYDI